MSKVRKEPSVHRVATVKTAMLVRKVRRVLLGHKVLLATMAQPVLPVRLGRKDLQGLRVRRELTGKMAAMARQVPLGLKVHRESLAAPEQPDHRVHRDRQVLLASMAKTVLTDR